MQQISKVTKDLNIFADALQGKWDRHSSAGAVWVLCGRVVFLEGKIPDDFMYSSETSSRTGKHCGIVAWHHFGISDDYPGGSFHIGFLGDETGFPDTTGEGGGGVTEVFHDDTLTGKGTEDDPLSVVSQGLTVVEHNDTLTGDGTSESKLSVNTAQIPTKTYVDTQDAQVAANAAEWVEEEAGARATADTALQTQIDYDRENYGIMMKYVATNTLKFYRPTSIILPDPIYELTQTTFTGSSSQVISSGYRLLQGDAYASETNLISWTLFINIISNDSTGGGQYLYEDGGYWTGTSTYYNIQGGRVGSNNCVLNDGYNDIYQGTQGVGKIGIRRGSGVDFIEYTSNGKTWIPISTLQISRFGTRTAKMLRFGGNAAGSSSGRGTISAKLWGVTLDNISHLF